MWWSRQAAVGIALLLLVGCGFEPLHAERRNGISTVDQMSQVKVDPVQDISPLRLRLDDRYDQVLRNELLKRLNPDGQLGQPRYALQIKLAQSEGQVAIEPDGTSARTNVSITANYRLISLDDGKAVLQGSSTGVNSYGVITNSYATLVGGQDAHKRALQTLADDIVRRVALYFRRKPVAQE